MDMPIGNVTVGSFLVKGRYVREIVRDYGSRVQYRTYTLATGKPEPILEACTKQHLILWAERHCTPLEVSRLKVAEAKTWEPNVDPYYIRVLLDVIPDDELIKEVRRRGLPFDGAS